LKDYQSSPRYIENKAKESLQREHVRQALVLLQRYNLVLTFHFMPDRYREVDLIIDTGLITHRVEMKALEDTWTFKHGDPEQTKSYEHNFPSRRATMMITTRHAYIPAECWKLPNVETPTPSELSQIQPGPKSHPLILRTALQLESVLYYGEGSLLRYLRRSSMYHQNTDIHDTGSKPDYLLQHYKALIESEKAIPTIPYTTHQQLRAMWKSDCSNFIKFQS
jgi:hypothetical protein